jgi:sugar O-acyltransferase (sialic acid O-acetyltransferase NeuD family)
MMKCAPEELWAIFPRRMEQEENELSPQAIWIIGAGGHAKVVAAAAETTGLGVAGFLDDDAAKNGAVLLGRSVRAPIAPQSWWTEEPRAVHIAIGANKVRRRFAGELPACWRTVIHATAWVHSSSSVEEGSLICAGAVIQPEASVGKHVIINTNVTIEHDCRVSNFVHIASGACLAGGATIGEGGFIGAGAVVLPGVRIGAWATIGAGAVVVGNIADGKTVAGSPAREIAR